MIVRLLAALAFCVVLASPSAFAFSVSNDEAGIKFEMPLEPTFKKTEKFYWTSYDWDAFGSNFGTGRYGGALVKVIVNKALRFNRLQVGDMPGEDILRGLSSGGPLISDEFFERNGNWGQKLVFENSKDKDSLRTAWLFIPDGLHTYLILYIGPRGSEDHPVVKAMFDSFRWTPRPAPKAVVVADREKGASALFPVDPGFVHKATKQKDGSYFDQHLWSAWRGGLNWSMQCTEIVGKTKTVFHRDRLEPGRDYLKPDRGNIGQLKNFYMDEKRICQLFFVGPTGTENRQDVRDFFASFKIVPRNKPNAPKAVAAKPGAVSARFEIPFERILLDRMIYKGKTKSDFLDPSRLPFKYSNFISLVKTGDGNLYQENVMESKNGACLKDEDTGVIYRPGGEPYTGAMKCERTKEFQGKPWIDRFDTKYVTTISLDGGLLTLTLNLDGSLRNPAGVYAYRLRQTFRIRLNGSECDVEGWSRDGELRERPADGSKEEGQTETAVLENAALCSLIR